MEFLAFRGEASYGHDRGEPECAGRSSANERHAIGQRVVLDAQPIAAGGNCARKLLVAAREGGFEIGSCAQLLGDLRQRTLVGADVFG